MFKARLDTINVMRGASNLPRLPRTTVLENLHRTTVTSYATTNRSSVTSKNTAIVRIGDDISSDEEMDKPFAVQPSQTGKKTLAYKKQRSNVGGVKK